MKFTVLGASGVIGQHVVKFLRSRNIDVFTPERNDTALFSQPLGNIIYAIGLTADFRTRPIDTVQSHVCMLADILKHGDFNSLLYLSSTRLYSGSTTSTEKNIFCVRPQDPSDLYNLSKLMGESLCLSCKHKGVKIARLSNVVGGEDEDSDNFLPSLIREAQNGKIILRTDPSSEKDYIHINDVAYLLYQIATTGLDTIYNVASGQQVTHAEWVNHLISLTGCSYEVKANAPVIRFVPIDIKKLTNEFHFQPQSVLRILPTRKSTEIKNG